MESITGAFKALDRQLYPLTLNAPVNDLALARVGRILGHPLPMDYSRTLLQHNGVNYDPNDGVMLKDCLLLLPVDRVITVSAEAQQYLKTTGKLDVWQSNWYPIATSVTENVLICIVGDGSTGTVKVQLHTGEVTVYQCNLVDSLISILVTYTVPSDVHGNINPNSSRPTVHSIVNPSKPTLESRSDTAPYKDIHDVVSHYTKDIRVDKRYVKRLVTFVHRYENRCEEHIDFLGGNLLGINRLIYVSEVENEWIEEIVGLDDIDGLCDDYRDLPSVYVDNTLTASVANLSFVAVGYLLINSPHINAKERELGLIAVFNMMQYKFISSILYHFFKYRTQEAIAQSVYESLSRKSAIKRYHTWGNLIRERSKSVIDKGGIHYKTIQTLRDDKAVFYITTDLFTRLKSIVKNMTEVYYDLRDADTRILTKELYNISEDGVALKDFENKTESLIENMIRVAGDRNDFIRQSIIEQTVALVPTCGERHLETALNTLTDMSDTRQGKGEIDDLLRAMIMYMEAYLRKAARYDKNIINLVVKMRNLFRSSQLRDDGLIQVREITNRVVELALPKHRERILTATRVGMLVYITLRILTYDKYKG